MRASGKHNFAIATLKVTQTREMNESQPFLSEKSLEIQGRSVASLEVT